MNKLPASILAVALVCTFSIGVHAAPKQIIAVALKDASTDPSITGMVVKIEPAVVKAGRVTLEAVNQSTNLVHEVLVVPVLPAGKDMPYDKSKDTVIEKRVHPLGEISDLQPGARATLALNLKPGSYLLLCNQPGHYKSGMSTTLLVEK